MSKKGDLIGITREYRILKNLIASGKVEVQHFYAETSVGGKFKKPFYKISDIGHDFILEYSYRF